jgi:hypothetical protein
MQKVNEALESIIEKSKELFTKLRRWICGCNYNQCKNCDCYNNDDDDWESFMNFDIIGYETAPPPKEKKTKKKSIAPVKAVKKIAKKVIKKI